ncbi:MAG TPA: hypothetical protein VMM18_16890 [Gemmatimonadaceae bacterium]|nr:hypothetical protein [Gemmatimonadaceae bacterium]
MNMPSNRTRREGRLALVLLLVVAPAVIAGACAPARQWPEASERYRQLRGSLAGAETTFVGTRGRYTHYRVALQSTSGLHATGQLLVPPGGGPFPAILLNAGREANSDALYSLPADFGDVVVLSLDYPETFPYAIGLRRILFGAGPIRTAADTVPAAFSLGGAWLVRRDDVDSSRTGIVGSSFAVPFVTIAAALDERFRNVGLIYGAGDMPRVVAANLKIRPRFLRGALARLAMRPFADLEPTLHVHRIAPRPLVMVNGIDDPQMPVRAVQALHDAAREPKLLIWLRTGHLMPDDAELIEELVDTAFARMPVLSGGG